MRQALFQGRVVDGAEGVDLRDSSGTRPISGALSAARPLVLSEREATCQIGSSTLNAMTAVRLSTAGGPGEAPCEGGGALPKSLAVRALVSLVPTRQ